MTSRTNQVKISLGLTKYALLATLRNRANLFFSLLFPLGFVFVFGLFNNGSSRTSIGITPDFKQKNPLLYQVLQKVSAGKDAPLKLVDGESAALKQQVVRGKLEGLLEEDGAQAQLLTSSASPIGAATAQGLLRGVTDQVNLRAAEAVAGTDFKPPVDLKYSEVAGKEFRYIDFALPGMVGFSLISLGSFGVAFPFLMLRRTLVLKRALATSAKPISFVVSQCLSRSLQALVQTAIIFEVGVLVFHFALPRGAETMLELMVVAFFGVLSFMGFGVLISNIAKDESTAPLALNLFTLPQFLLSGVFFPSDTLPSWVRVVGDNLPLSFLTQAFRKITTEGAHLDGVAPQLIGMIVWSMISFALAAKTFRAE